jgi:plastocyanin
VVALAVCAPAAALPAQAVAKPPHYCKKKASKLTKKQRRRCKRARRHHATTTPAGGPLTEPPVVPPVGDPPATDPPSGPTTTAPLGRLGVRAEEFKLTPSRTQLTAGDALVELQNAGEDAHDLHIEPTGGGALTAAFPETDPGTRHKEQVSFTPGTYKLYCSLPGHEGLGMRATLTVVPSAP